MTRKTIPHHLGEWVSVPVGAIGYPEGTIRTGHHTSGEEKEIGNPGPFTLFGVSGGRLLSEPIIWHVFGSPRSACPLFPLTLGTLCTLALLGRDGAPLAIPSKQQTAGGEILPKSAYIFRVQRQKRRVYIPATVV